MVFALGGGVPDVGWRCEHVERWQAQYERQREAEAILAPTFIGSDKRCWREG